MAMKTFKEDVEMITSWKGNSGGQRKLDIHDSAAPTRCAFKDDNVNTLGAMHQHYFDCVLTSWINNGKTDDRWTLLRHHTVGTWLAPFDCIVCLLTFCCRTCAFSRTKRSFAKLSGILTSPELSNSVMTLA
jgi:hypothetical protein